MMSSNFKSTINFPFVFVHGRLLRVRTVGLTQSSKTSNTDFACT